MNDHPVVLKKRIQAVTVCGYKVWLSFEDRSILHRVSQQNERRTSQLKIKTRNNNAEYHGGEKRLHKSEHGHYWCFPEFVCIYHYNPEYSMPKQPK